MRCCQMEMSMIALFFLNLLLCFLWRTFAELLGIIWLNNYELVIDCKMLFFLLFTKVDCFVYYLDPKTKGATHHQVLMEHKMSAH